LLGVILCVLQEHRVTDFLDRRSLIRSVCEKAHNEVFKALTEALTVHGFEIGVVAFLSDHLVVFILEDLGTVRELALHDDEKKDSHGEQVDFSAIVDELFEDLWGDIAG